MIKLRATRSSPRSVLSLHGELLEQHPLLHYGSRRLFHFQVDKIEIPFIMVMASGFLNLNSARLAFGEFYKGGSGTSLLGGSVIAAYVMSYICSLTTLMF